MIINDLSHLFIVNKYLDKCIKVKKQNFFNKIFGRCKMLLYLCNVKRDKVRSYKSFKPFGGISSHIEGIAYD